MHKWFYYYVGLTAVAQKRFAQIGLNGSHKHTMPYHVSQFWAIIHERKKYAYVLITSENESNLIRLIVVFKG